MINKTEIFRCWLCDKFRGHKHLYYTLSSGQKICKKCGTTEFGKRVINNISISILHFYHEYNKFKEEIK